MRKVFAWLFPFGPGLNAGQWQIPLFERSLVEAAITFFSAWNFLYQLVTIKSGDRNCAHVLWQGP